MDDGRNARRAIFACLTVAVITSSGTAAGREFAWQREYAKLGPAGEIEWTPRAFEFRAGKVVRYIDYEQGDDSGSGSREQPWKHHPWDVNAVGKAAAASGVDTHVFKGGVIYRGVLELEDQGGPGSPIRLTRDPRWGEGAAILAGSQRIGGFTRGAHPKMPDDGKIWKTDLDVAPRALWMIGTDGASTRIPLARHPNWTSQAEDHKAEWFCWSNDKHPFQAAKGWTANDAKKLKGLDEDFVRDALVYSEFGWVMGTPYPTPVRKYDPATGGVQFAGWTGGGNASVIFRGMRYYLEDKPQYLDDPNGEFWFEKKGDGGTLYLRAPGDVDPNRLHLEAGFRPVLIEAVEARHLEISGLDFRWCPKCWNLAVTAWDTSTKPFGVRADATPAAIRVRGNADHVRIANCSFEGVAKGIEMRAMEKGQGILNVTIEDNRFRDTDIGAAHLSNGTGWGFANPVGRLDNIRLYRNHASGIGFRPTRYERGCAFDFTGAERLHVAGNVIERCGAQAINVSGGKTGGMRGEVPLVRVLIHQNKAWKTMQNANDFGGIEAWQHGPVYIFNNLSHDARGQWEGRRRNDKNGTPGFGHAYYLDGGFKNYLFNNIAWGKSKDQKSPLVNCSAFQEIHSFQNCFFNNSIYNFAKGSRRQAPEAGRNKFIGNVWQDISQWVFWHSKPAGARREANADHAGEQGEHFDFGTNAFAGNVFHNFNREHFGSYTPDGGWIGSPGEFSGILEKTGALAAGTGVVDEQSPLVDPGKGDFRLKKGSAAIDGGARVFVPWSLSAVVAEWNFYPAGDDPTRIIDEHWFARDYMTERTSYEKQPMYPLKGVNIERSDYVNGPLENYVTGALRLDPARKTHAVLGDEVLNQSITWKIATRSKHGQDPQVKDVTFRGRDLRNAEIYDGNFLIEACFKADSDGLLIGKMSGAGYMVAIEGGKAVFRVRDGSGQSAELSSTSSFVDGRWRHLVVEADRAADELRVYVDGRIEGTGKGIGNASLENDGDLFVGGSDKGDYLDATLEFLRISLGTLADAHTTIEELYAWEFDGPALRDFSGQAAKGEGRDAGAVETF